MRRAIRRLFWDLRVLHASSICPASPNFGGTPWQRPSRNEAEKSFKDHAVKKGLPWYDLNIDELLTYVSSVLEEHLEEQKCAHYANMDVGA